MSKKGLIFTLGLAGGFIVGKYGDLIVEKIKSNASNISFEELLAELENQKSNLFKKDEEEVLEDNEDGTLYTTIKVKDIEDDSIELESIDAETEDAELAELEAELAKLEEDESETEESEY